MSAPSASMVPGRSSGVASETVSAQCAFASSAAQDLHRAVRAAIDPEAFSDFHGNHPFIELRNPADIIRPWRPGSEITDRQAAAMGRIQADLRDRARSAE